MVAGILQENYVKRCVRMQKEQDMMSQNNQVTVPFSQQ